MAIVTRDKEPTIEVTKPHQEVASNMIPRDDRRYHVTDVMSGVTLQRLPEQARRWKPTLQMVWSW